MDVEFNNESQYTSLRANQNIVSKSSIVRKLLERGIVSSESAANIMIVFFIILMFGLGIFITLAGRGTSQITYREDLPSDVREKMSPDILETFPSRNNQQDQSNQQDQ